MENELEQGEVQQNSPEEQAPQETEMPEYVKEIESKNRQLWERTKKVENQGYQILDKLAEFEKKTSQTPLGASDAEVDRILEIKSATEGLDAKQIGYLRDLSKIKKISLTDARQHEDFGLWNEAYGRKVEKENIPLPSTTQGNVKGEKTYKEMNLEERTKYFEELGLIAHQTSPRPSRQ